MLPSKCAAPAPTAVADAPAAPPEPALVQPNALALDLPAAVDPPAAPDAPPASQELAPAKRASKYRWSPTTAKPAAPPAVPVEAEAKKPAGAAPPQPPTRRQVVRVHQVSRHYEYHVEHVYERDGETPRS